MMGIPFEFIRDYSDRIKFLSDDIFSKSIENNVETTAGVAMLAALLLPAYDRVFKENPEHKTEKEKIIHTNFLSELKNKPFELKNTFDEHFDIDRMDRSEWAPIQDILTNTSPVQIQYSVALNNIRNAIAHGHVFYLNTDRVVIAGDVTAGVAFVRNNSDKTYVTILSNMSLKHLFDILSKFLSKHR